MVINGNQYVRGTLSAKSLLFNEVANSSDMTRGANFNLVSGRLVYQVDSNNTFEFYHSTDIQELLAGGVPQSSGSSTSVIASTPTILNLLNTTFFSVSDDTGSYFFNLNFDFTTDPIKMSSILDKVVSSTYKNGFLRKNEYQLSPSYLATQYKNTAVLAEFSSIKLDLTAVNPIDQSSVIDLYFNNLSEWSSSDISNALDYILLDNTSDSTLSSDISNLLSTKFFSIGQINPKLDLLLKREAFSELHKSILNRDHILYFFENFMTLYKVDTLTRLKVYFFDYLSLIQNNIFALIDYIKDVQTAPNDYSNDLSQNILTYKADHTEITDQTKNYTSFIWDFNADELIKSIFETDTAFTSAIDWSSLDVTVSMYQQDIDDLNTPDNNELTLTNKMSFDYYGNGNINPVISRINLSSGQVSVPLFEVDFPLDSLFFFMI